MPAFDRAVEILDCNIVPGSLEVVEGNLWMIKRGTRVRLSSLSSGEQSFICMHIFI